jgi:mono/diheme cytochrome c family protein
VRGPNISAGPGNAVDGYTPADWERALRHGVARGGRPLFVMPSEDYARLTDVDLGAIVAYVRSLPPAAGGPAILELPLPVRVLYGYGAIKDAAAKIDHALPPPQPVAEGVTVEHGNYVAAACIGCHGPHLSGGRIPGAPPDWPPASNLTPGADSAMPRYASAAQFAQMFRSGTRPDGTPIKIMPFEALKQMNDTDIGALYMYLKTVPARPAGER